MTTTSPPSVEDARAALVAKDEQLRAQDERIADLKRKLADTAVAEGDTRAVRDELREAEERKWDLGAQRVRLEQDHAAAVEVARHRRAFQALAELYRDRVEFLRARAELLDLEDKVAAARERVNGMTRDPERPLFQKEKPILRAWYGRQPTHDEVARFLHHGADGIAIEHMAGVASNGGDTSAEVLADAERFERLAAEAEDRAEALAAGSRT